jgi:hypothetical protein
MVCQLVRPHPHLLRQYLCTAYLICRMNCKDMLHFPHYYHSQHIQLKFFKLGSKKTPLKSVFLGTTGALPGMHIRGSAPGHGIEIVYFPSRSFLNLQ